MTIVKPVQIDVANRVFEAWNKLGVAGRASLLERSLAQLTPAQANMAKWQLDNARHEIGEAHVLPGPTGESNVLYTHGRGPIIATVQAGLTGESISVGLVGQIYAALVAGNPVITVGLEGQKLMDIITKSVAAGVIQNVADSAEDSLIEADDVAGVAILCDAQHAQALFQRLADKSGLLCQLMEETNTEALTTIGAPNYILRFVTEQTVTTNTTAIGGNATLLELGSKSE